MSGLPAVVYGPWGRLISTVAATSVVFTVAIVMILNLKHVGEIGVETERNLHMVRTELHVQDALEWRAHGERLAVADVATKMAQSRARARAVLASTAAHDASLAREVGEAHDRYAAALDEEMQLIAGASTTEQTQSPGAGDPTDRERSEGHDGLGHSGEAGHDDHEQPPASTGGHAHGSTGSHGEEAHDDAEVDAAFAAAMATLEKHHINVGAVAARARLLSDLGIVFVVVLALTVTAVVQSRRRRAEVRRDAERRGEARYRALVNRASDLVIVTDRQGRVRYLSPSAERVFGLEVEAAIAAGCSLFDVVHPEDTDVVRSCLDGPGDADLPPFEMRLAGPGGVRIYETSVQNLAADPAVGGIVFSAHDVTERQELQAEMQRRTMHDELTGLPNRALLSDRFEQALRHAKRDGHAVALLLVDLDRFKDINDSLGHRYGDLLLQAIGPRLRSLLRESDTIARLGGDEFAVLLPHAADLAAATAVAAKLHEALGFSFRLDGVDLDIEASIGVVISGAHGDDAAILMQRADVAMYVAKRRSAGVTAYDPSIDVHAPERLALLGDLRRALQNGDLFLHYQPKISIGTGEICGAEALLRWPHPERGFIPPDQFIPLAENTGLIGPLTRYVLDLALAQARHWMDAGAPLPVAVNLSARNLLDESIDTVVMETLARHGVPAHLLKLEVTETAIMSEPDRAALVLGRLAAAGIALSIDDFGAGYTSLGQLKHLPISELKVDRSFVMTMESDPSDALIVHSVIQLGHTLGLSIVAEGVETQEALGSLSSYACDVAQGYHLSRPLAPEAFDAWRSTWAGLTADTVDEDSVLF